MGISQRIINTLSALLKGSPEAFKEQFPSCLAILVAISFREACMSLFTLKIKINATAKLKTL
jgi:hypothetical protein